MSLISDTNYLIHQIRLSYLRDFEDPYGARIVSLDPAYHNNPYIAAAGLADPDRWPELNAPRSPELSEDEHENQHHTGYPGARLKYTQTIMGGKSGGFGMRVHAKRASTSKRLSQIQAAAAAGRREAEERERQAAAGGAKVEGDGQAGMNNFVAKGAAMQIEETLSTSAPASTPAKANGEDSWVTVDDDKAKLDVASVNVQIQVPTAPVEAPVQKVVQFVPKFTAETEARRRMRIAARRGPGAGPAPPAPSKKPLSWDTSSEEEEEEEVSINVDSESSEDDFGESLDSIDDNMNDDDVFDPEFAATRVVSDSMSENASILSGMSSIPPSSMADSSAHGHYRPGGARLSPVTERRRAPSRSRTHDSAVGSHEPTISKKKSNNMLKKDHTGHHAPSSSISSSTELSFARKKVPPAAKPQKSALSSMLASTGSSSNPFAELYAAISGRAESASTNVQVYFPHASRPAGKAMDLNVRKDATVEEVIGYALWNYWEEGWLPKLDEGLSDDEDDPKRRQMLSAVGWIMRIAEDDGEVDDDFPPPDRMGKITKFNADAYAILEANSTQVQQNEILEAKIQRRPSRTMNSKKREDKLTAPPMATIPSAGGSASSFIGSAVGSIALSTSLGPSFSHGPQIFLRIRVANAADAVHISTTIPVSAGMYMQEALEMVCRRRKLENPKDYALLLTLPEATIMIPLDRTVASLQGNRELLLVRRDDVDKLGVNVTKEGKTTDPNASILKHMSDTPEQIYSSQLNDLTASYKKYTIYRKMPMLVTRQERTLAIDGVYIHIMPTTNKAKNVFDHGKTSSYHIKSIADCQQSGKSSTFKLVLNRGSRNKRYDFEAEDPKIAAEIVQKIMSLKTALERSGTVGRSRRSRQAIGLGALA